ncbi:cytochrome P450 hydroxylase [Actinomycetes bacterium]|nr:cytochrome P450 hydroxylase [Actinomycetes bacterium]
MAISINELDIPQVDFDFVGSQAERDQLASIAQDSWIAKGLFAYPIFNYEDCLAILRDRRWHSAAALAAIAFGVDDPRLSENRQPSILSSEGEVHTRLRRLVAPSFSPRAADHLRPFMREVMNSLIDPIVAQGHCDLAVDICEHYPIPIICELLGAPKSDWQFFSRVAEDVLRIFDANNANEIDLILAAQADLDAYVRQLISERRNSPADDLITSLIAAEEAGDKLSENELVSMVEAVIIGGTDTTRNQLGCSVALFAEHPEQWKLLAERPELAGKAVEETMRYFGAVRSTGRFASEDIEYKGVLFPKGTLVVPSLVLANRDSAVFNEPNTFDITREPAGQPQMTFGAGIHYCLGAALARAEQQEALPILAQRLPNLRINGDVIWKPSTVAIFGPENLPIAF